MKTPQIYQIGDRVIRSKSKKVVDPQSFANRGLIKKMIRIMYREHLVGIAAPQVGVNRRIFITQPRPTKFRLRGTKSKIVVYINPKVVKSSRLKQLAYEGCGSVAHAGIFGKVPRSNSVTIKAQDREGAWFILNATGFLARIIQHEYDHLEGIVFLDRVKDTRSLLDRDTYISHSK